MTVIVYRLRLEEPVLVTGLEGDPNDSETLNYLPGSVLRGALVDCYRQKKGDLDSAHPDVRRLFLDGTTRFLNGYLVVRGQRGFPMPLSLVYQKGNTNDNGMPKQLYDLAVDEPDADPSAPWQTVPTTFGWPDLRQPIIYSASPRRRLKIHTQRDRHYGRSREDSGAVYRYQALAPGQTFEAVVLCDNVEDATLLKNYLQGELYLGGARTAGYGRVTVSLQQNAVPQGWREVSNHFDFDPQESDFTLTLLSDAWVRSPWGQFNTDPDTLVTELSRALQCKVTSETSFLRGQLSGGFNRKWNLPLPQAVALAMGSVFKLRANGTPVNFKQRLQQLEWQGIGERREEGFGRVVVNWLGNETWDLPVHVIPPKIPTVFVLTGDNRQLAQRMAERLLQARLDVHLPTRARHITLEHAPRNAQLARLRDVVRESLRATSTNLKRVHDFLDNVESRPAAQRQFNRALVQDTQPQGLLDWLRNVLGNTNNMDDWRRIIDPTDRLEWPSVAGVTVQLSEEMRVKSLLRLVDAVLSQARRNED